MRLRQFNKEKELKKIRKKENKQKYIKRNTAIINVLLLVIGVMFVTFAIYRSSKEYVIIDGTVGIFNKVSFETVDLIVGLDDTNGILSSNRIKYSITNKVVTVSSSVEDGWGPTNAHVYLEEGKTYHFSCKTDGTWGNSNSSDTVEVYILLNGSVINWVRFGKGEQDFTVNESGMYYLRFDVNQGGNTHTFSDISIKETIDSRTVHTNTSYGTLPTPTKKEGYIFKGWFTSDDKGDLVKDSTIKRKSTNQTLYAIYSKSSVLTINPNGGTYDSNSNEVDIERSVGDYYTLATPTREGYVFKGWNLEGNGTLMTGLDSYNDIKGTSLFNKTLEKDDYEYTHFSLETSSDVNKWGIISYNRYPYELGHEYEISFFSRINNIQNNLGNYMDYRHASITNDYYTDDKVVLVIGTTHYTWSKTTFSRTFNSDTVINNGNGIQLEPHFEIYTNTINGENIIYDFDIRDIVIKDKTTNTYVFDSRYIFSFGSDNSTLSAIWETE